MNEETFVKFFRDAVLEHNKHIVSTSNIGYSRYIVVNCCKSAIRTPDRATCISPEETINDCDQDLWISVRTALRTLVGW